MSSASGDSETFDVYTAIVFQPDVLLCSTRADVRKNVEHIAAILSSSEMARRGVFNTSNHPEPWEKPPWAPLKLVALPELCLNLPGGFYGEVSVDQLIESVAIEIPGPETEILSDVCRKQGFYLACGAYEFLPIFPGRIFNSAFVIDPTGDIIHRSHKFNPYLPIEQYATSPHDIYDDYIRIYGGGRPPLDVLFPVTHTEIGAIGTLICNDGLYPENWRALALRGAEVIIHGNLPEPFASPPRDWREIFGRTFAVANMCYVISPSFGSKVGDATVKYATGGANGSFIADPEGMIVAQIPYPGEGVTSGTVRLDHLRRRRRDPGTINLLAHLRTEPYSALYRESIYPPNLLLLEPVRGSSEKQRRDVYETGAMASLFNRNVLKAHDSATSTPGGRINPSSEEGGR